MGRMVQSTGRGLAWFFALGVLFCLNLAQPQRIDAAIPAINTNAGSLGFAIADLDGDRQPDLALVEIEREQVSSTRYAIRVCLGGGTDLYVGVKGPLGGLRVAVRDVNNDDSLDLILTSAMDRRVIQVLLNDGHGRFVAADAASFGNLQDDSDRRFRDREAAPSDRLVAIGVRTSFDADAVGQHESLRCDADSAPERPASIAPITREPGASPGRSPPAVLILS